MNDVSRHLKRLLWGRFFWGIVDWTDFYRSFTGIAMEHYDVIIIGAGSTGSVLATV